MPALTGLVAGGTTYIHFCTELPIFYFLPKYCTLVPEKHRYLYLLKLFKNNKKRLINLPSDFVALTLHE